MNFEDRLRAVLAERDEAQAKIIAAQNAADERENNWVMGIFAVFLVLYVIFK